GAFVCGPKLTWGKNGQAKRSDAGPPTAFAARPEGYPYEVDGDDFAVKALPDHWNLVMSGPTDTPGFGNGMCQGAPSAELSVYALSPSGEFSAAVRIDDEY